MVIKAMSMLNLAHFRCFSNGRFGLFVICWYRQPLADMVMTKHRLYQMHFQLTEHTRKNSAMYPMYSSVKNQCAS